MKANEKGEEWRDIQGAPGYQASSLGRIRSFRPRTCGKTPRDEPVVMALSPKVRGRSDPVSRSLRVNLAIDKRKASFPAHRLIAITFLGPCPDGEGRDAVHLDGDTTNNAPSNLIWATRSESYRLRQRQKAGAQA